MSAKKIVCEYANNEDIIKEYISTVSKQNDIPIIGVMIIALLFGIYGLYTNSDSRMNWLWIGIAAFMGFSEIYSSRRMIAKRQAQRYKKKYGRINPKIKVVLSDKVRYSIDGHQIDFKWRSIVGVSETENLLILSYPSEMVPLRRDRIKNATYEETRAFIRDHIAEDKTKQEKEKADRKAVKKAIRKDQKDKMMKKIKK